MFRCSAWTWKTFDYGAHPILNEELVVELHNFACENRYAAKLLKLCQYSRHNLSWEHLDKTHISCENPCESRC